MERDDRRSRPEDRPPAPALHRPGAARLRAGGPALTEAPGSEEVARGAIRRFILRAIAGGVLAATLAGLATSLAPDVHVGDLLMSAPFTWLAVSIIVAVFVILTVESLIALVRWLTRRGRAPPAMIIPLAYARLATHLAMMTALILLGVAALCANFFDRSLAAALGRALVFVLVLGVSTTVTLTVVDHLVRLVRYAAGRVNPAPPSAS